MPLNQLQNDDSRTDQKAYNRKDHGRHDRHDKIKAGQAVAPQETGEEAGTLFQENLYVASGPTCPLPPGLAEKRRLLIKEFCRAAVANPLTLHNAVGREFNIFRKSMEGPAAIPQHNLAAEQKACAGYHAADAQTEPRSVEGRLPPAGTREHNRAEIQLSPKFLELR